MKRLVVASGILVLVAFGVSLARQSPAPDAHGASLLLITIDTLRADRVGAYGGPPGLTPAIDRVAAAGVVFDEALTSVPLTLPSHATIMSGLDPFHHGARNNGGRLAQTYETLATRLKAAGYATGAFVAAAVLDHRFGLSRGFDVYDDAIARAARGRSTLESERPCGVVVSRAARWIEKQTGPLFAWVHIYEPHAPYTPPDDLAGAHPGKPYDAEVAAADRCVNELLEGIAKFTPRQWLTVVMSDHGEGLGEHGERTHGLFVYQSTLRVPLVMAGPGLTRGERRRGIARTADVTPTLLALLGASAIPGLDGIDLFGPLTRSESYAETDYPTGFGWTGLRSWRAGGLKLINGPRPELFDVARDPREGRNLATERGADVTRLQRILRLALSAEVKADIRPVSAEVEERLRSLGYVSGRLRRPATGPQKDPKEVVALFQEFERAVEAEGKGDLPFAAKALRQLVKAEPANLTFKRSLASLLRRTGQGDEAIRLLKVASLEAPRDATLANELSAALAERGLKREALAEARRATALDPRFADAQDHLATLYTASGDLPSARAAADRATAIDSNNARAWTNRANILRAQARPAEAKADYERALAVDPNFADAVNGLGVLAVDESKLADAAELFTRARALDPQLDEASINLAVVEFQRGNRARALELASEVARESPNPLVRARATAFVKNIRP